MASPRNRKVSSLVEFIKVVDGLLDKTRQRNPNSPTAHNWYRGISKGTSYHLQAGLFRVDLDTPSDYLNLESQMMRDFERQALLQGPSAHSTQGLELLLRLFHMQHYGIPTRLLDWTTNPLIALYFALSSDSKSTEDPVVWAMDPWAWNRSVLSERDWKDKGPADTSEPVVKKAYMPQNTPYDVVDVENAGSKPIALLGMFNTERMRAQRGVFTMFGKMNQTMEDVYDENKVETDALVKISISRNEAAEIFGRLIALGYTDSVSYPDFHGVALEIRRAYGYLS